MTMVNNPNLTGFLRSLFERFSILVLGMALNSGAAIFAQGFNTGGAPKKATSAPQKKSSPPPSQHSRHEPSPRHLTQAVAMNLGWEATYGNGASYHYYPKKWFDINGGIGYNKSGMKLGAGVGLDWFLLRSFGLRSGLALVYSSGSSGEVAIDGKFKPENSEKEEDITASKTYEVASAMMLNSLVGGFWALSQSCHLFFEGTYNVVLSGNEVTFDDDIQFSREIEASNRLAAEQDFEVRARDKAEAGGAGFNLGLRFLF